MEKKERHTPHHQDTSSSVASTTRSSKSLASAAAAAAATSSCSTFVRLNETLSYQACTADGTVEVLPTQDVASIATTLQHQRELNRKERKKGGNGHAEDDEEEEDENLFGIPMNAEENRKKTANLSKRPKRITRNHAQYALTAGMILGIRECVGVFEPHIMAKMMEEREGGVFTEEESLADFCLRECRRVKKYRFSSQIPTKQARPSPPSIIQQAGEGLSLSDNGASAAGAGAGPDTQPYHYEFKSYAPLVFEKIRAHFGINKQYFLHSICGKFNFIEFMSNAKSGQFFFFSHDGQYMIKTQTKRECNFLQEILPRYTQHLVENPHTLLTHFYGMYRVSMSSTTATSTKRKVRHFCIMKSVFNTPREIHRIYDLKGSTLGRRANRGDAVRKDLDIMEDGRKLFVGASRKQGLVNLLRADAAFLSRMGIMDYSFLVGIHHRLDNDDDNNNNNNSGGDGGGQEEQNTGPTAHDNVKDEKKSGDAALPQQQAQREQELKQQGHGQQQQQPPSDSNSTSITKKKSGNTNQTTSHSNNPFRSDYAKSGGGGAGGGGNGSSEDEDEHDMLDDEFEFGSDGGSPSAPYAASSIGSRSSMAEYEEITFGATTSMPWHEEDSLVHGGRGSTGYGGANGGGDPIATTADGGGGGGTNNAGASSSTDQIVCGEERIDLLNMTICCDDNIWTDVMGGTTASPTTATTPPKSAIPAHANGGNTSKNPITSRNDLGIESFANFKLTREIYYCGIIDILQDYDARKWGETVMRKAAGNSGSEISCVDPEAYANRFVTFLDSLIE